MNVMGQIGTKMNMRVNYNTEATFDYENKMNLEYAGEEDEILKLNHLSISDFTSNLQSCESIIFLVIYYLSINNYLSLRSFLQ